MVACGGEIKQTSLIKTVGTKVGNEIIATRGDAVIKIINKESMPNAFGKADIFGRTRDTGTTSLIFIGFVLSIFYLLKDRKKLFPNKEVT